MYLRGLCHYDQLPWDRFNIRLSTYRVIDYVTEHKEKFLIGHGTSFCSLFVFSVAYDMPLQMRIPLLVVSGVNIFASMIMCGLTRPSGFMPSGDPDETVYVEAAAYGMA